ncbi:hypothetical protein EVAR_63326_1 [Eumeta japonica]|uniref:Uncharacterized protein n=1 Tax=Eumeta variegata TaxID=151549 RepID=A0A4C1YQT1_EUMVA|nr:hypothetical protein EVAR_63326_1 [Eumeta japonica]
MERAVVASSREGPIPRPMSRVLSPKRRYEVCFSSLLLFQALITPQLTRSLSQSFCFKCSDRKPLRLVHVVSEAASHDCRRSDDRVRDRWRNILPDMWSGRFSLKE